MQCSSAAGGNDTEIPSFCYSFAAYKEREHSCLRGFGIPTLIPVIRLPCRSRARAGAIGSSLKRKSLSHSTPGKFERSSQNSFQKAPISNAPGLERWRGEPPLHKIHGRHAYTKPGDGRVGQPLWG